MAAASRLGRQIEEVIAGLSKVDARFALIGGLALASHKVIRATQDIDLLSDATAIQTAFGELSVVSAEGLIGLKLQGFVNNLCRTQDLEDIKAVDRGESASAEDGRGTRVFPALQSGSVARGNSTVSVPADNGQPFAADGGIARMPELTSRDPFEALDDLMTVIEALCPVWPNRAIFSSTDRFLI